MNQTYLSQTLNQSKGEVAQIFIDIFGKRQVKQCEQWVLFVQNDEVIKVYLDKNELSEYLEKFQPKKKGKFGRFSKLMDLKDRAMDE